jgi:fatty-acyl-CoA synthase
VVYRDTRVTWPEFMARASRLASALKKADIQKGDRVAFLSRNLPALLEAHYGVPGSGAILVALNTRLSPKEIAYIMDHSGARALFVEDSLANMTIPGDLPGVDFYVNIPSGESSASPLPGPAYEEFLARGSPRFEMDFPADELEPIAINYTSGTTGQPKGCVYTHRAAYLQSLSKTIEMDFHAGSVYLWTLPMFHCNGWSKTWTVAVTGVTSVCLTRPDAPDIYRLVEKEGVTHMDGAPIVWARLNEYMAEKGLRFSHKVKINNGGASPSAKIIMQLEEKNIDFVHNYGLTESLDGFTVCEWQPQWNELTPEDRARLKLRQGVAHVAYGGLKVCDKQGCDVPENGQTLGEILIRGNTLMKEYYRQPEATEEAFAGGWFHTGDGAVVHANGYLEIRDRFKDIIISGGENISSLEVENVILTHPDVLEAACYGIKDENWGEAVKALVKLKPGASVTPQAIIDYCRENLAHYKCPKVVVFGEVPRITTGKVPKYQLRQQG